MILKYIESYMLFLAIVNRNGLGLHPPSQKTVRLSEPSGDPAQLGRGPWMNAKMIVALRRDVAQRLGG